MSTGHQHRSRNRPLLSRTGAHIRAWVLHGAGLHRLLSAAAVGWLAASGVLPADITATIGLGLACVSAAALMGQRITGRGQSQLTGWLLSTALLAGAVCALIGAARLAQPTETTLYSGPALIAAESHATDSGSYRTEIRTQFGPATALSPTPLPAAGTQTTTRAELETSGSQTIAFIRGRPEIRKQPGPVWQMRAHMRSFLADTSGTAHDGARLLPGLVVGDVSQVGDDLTEEMRTVSLSHVTAVSGANITIVSLAVLWVAGFVVRVRVVRIILAVAVTAGYVFIVGPEPSVTRAAAMGMVGALAMLRGTRTASLALLAAGIIGVLVYQPGLSGSVGFHLSVSATAALIILGQPLSDRLESWGLPRVVATALSVPLSAQAGVTPVLLGIDGTISAWSVLANALAAPAVAPATLLGMMVLVCSLLPGGTWLGSIIVAPANWSAWWIARLARVFANLPASELPWPAGLLGIGLSCVVLAGLCLIVLEYRILHRIGAGLLAAALAAGLLVPGIRIPVASGWAAMFCDVGQGSATLISLPGDDVLVIDAGEDEDRIDICLDQTGDQRVHLLISHFDADHFAGYAGTGFGRDVASVYFPAGTEHDPGLKGITHAFPEAQRTPVSAGQRFQFGSVHWTILWPPAIAGPAHGDENSRSVVVHVQTSTFSVIVPGDIGAQEQRRLATVTQPADVLAAPHHGSADLDEAYFQAAGAKLGVVSVGADNRYGHPTTRALAAFGTSPVLRTDECGSIVIDAHRQVSSGCPGFVLG